MHLHNVSVTAAMLEPPQPPVALREVFDVFTKNHAQEADAVGMTGEIAWRNQARRLRWRPSNDRHLTQLPNKQRLAQCSRSP
jgi:hypothetical protein